MCGGLGFRGIGWYRILGFRHPSVSSLVVPIVGVWPVGPQIDKSGMFFHLEYGSSFLFIGDFLGGLWGVYRVLGIGVFTVADRGLFVALYLGLFQEDDTLSHSPETPKPES